MGKPKRVSAWLWILDSPVLGDKAPKLPFMHILPDRQLPPTFQSLKGGIELPKNGHSIRVIFRSESNRICLLGISGIY